VRLIRRLATHVTTPEGHNATAYGLSRSSPQSFYRHHLSAIYIYPLPHCVCMYADMLVVRAQAESYAFMLTLSSPPWAVRCYVAEYCSSVLL
jgi:hypothetical protein